MWSWEWIVDLGHRRLPFKSWLTAYYLGCSEPTDPQFPFFANQEDAPSQAGYVVRNAAVSL